MEMCSVTKWMRTADPLALPARPEMLALPAARQLALPPIRLPLMLPAPVETALALAPPTKPQSLPVSAREATKLERRAARSAAVLARQLA